MGNLSQNLVCGCPSPLQVYECHIYEAFIYTASLLELSPLTLNAKLLIYHKLIQWYESVPKMTRLILSKRIFFLQHTKQTFAFHIPLNPSIEKTHLIKLLNFRKNLFICVLKILITSHYLNRIHVNVCAIIKQITKY